MIISKQIIWCPVEGTLPYYINFFTTELVPPEDNQPPGSVKKVRINKMEKDSINNWVGVTGDINIVYNYTPEIYEHVLEKARLASLYNITELENNKFSIYVDFDNYEVNQLITHNASRETWASSILTHESIKCHSKEVLIAHIKDDNDDAIVFARVQDTTLTINTDTSKEIYVYNGNCVITDSVNSYDTSAANTQNRSYSTTGNTSLTSTGCNMLILKI